MFSVSKTEMRLSYGSGTTKYKGKIHKKISNRMLKMNNSPLEYRSITSAQLEILQTFTQFDNLDQYKYE